MIGWQLEFLRPWWFLALIPVAGLLWSAWRIKHQQGHWQTVIEPKFQRLLLGANSQSYSQTNIRLAIAGLALIWLLAITALAGPSLKSVKLPAAKTQQGSVIILDLSLSMLADDIAPNRISRARFKLIDLLEKHPNLSVGLIGYAGSAHRITPISEDNQTLLEMLPALDPVIMPQYGSNPLAAMQLAEQMLQATHITQGHLIWVTDDLEPTQRTEIEAWLNSRNLSVSILAVGTQAGGTVQIPNYGLLRDDNEQIITPKLPYRELQQLSTATGSALTALTVDDRDLSLLIPSNLAAIAAEKQQEDLKEVVHKLDEGAAIILILIPLLAFAYRRGWLFSLSVLMILPIGSIYSPQSYAETEQNVQAQQTKTKLPNFLEVFETADQQAYRAWKNDNYPIAEALFESPQWKGAAQYRLGKYAEAANQFKRDPSANGHYNLGNALAKQGELKAAQTAYEKALSLQPEFAEAQSNLDLINQLLEQEKQSGESPQDGPGQSQSKESQQPETKPGQDKQDKQDQERQAQSDNQEANDNSNPENEQASSTDERNQNQQDEQQTTDSKEQGQAKQNQHDQKEQASSEQLAADQSQEGQQNNPDSQADSNETDDNRTPETEQSGHLNEGDNAAAESVEEMEQKRATDNWLKQIPDQPGLYLKRKFEYQYQQQNSLKSNPASGSDSPSSKSAEKIW